MKSKFNLVLVDSISKSANEIDIRTITEFDSGAPARAKLAWDRAPYSWNMVNLFSFGCHMTDRAYVRTSVRTYASTDCTGRVGETIKRKGGVSQACLGKSTSFTLDIHNMVN